MAATDDHGQTPLRRAVETSGTYQIASPRIAKLLIECGANVNANSAVASSILAEARRSQERNGHDKKLIELLEKMGAR